MSDEQFRKAAREAVEKYARTKPIDEAVWKKLEPRIYYTQADYGSAEDHARVGATLERAGREVRQRAATGCSTSRRRRRRSSRSSQRLGERELAEQRQNDDPATWQRIIIEKPFGRDLASAQGAERAAAQVLRRRAGLPHRPLPRQGDGAEPDGDALRQRDLRADLELQVHRPRADHGGGDARRRRRAAATTTRAAHCATWCRTTCSSSWRWSRWSRRRRWTRSASATRR